MKAKNYYYISPRGQMIQKDSSQGALATARKGGYVWFDYLSPARVDLEPLVSSLGLHPLSIEDSLDEEQIPKIEDYPKHSFILFNLIDYKNKEIVIDELDIFIGEKFLVTASKHGIKEESLLRELKHIVEMDLENTRHGPAYLAHILLDHVVDKKFRVIEMVEGEIDDTEELIMGDINHFDPVQLLTLRRNLISLRKSLFHEREILIKICRNDCRFIGMKALLLYRDIYDHLTKFFELTENDRDIIASLMEMYLSMLNNQMAKAANDTNATVRRLTFITTIFMPLTLLAGIGGMSEWSMMTGPDNWRIAYPLFLLAMLVIGVVNYFVLKWLERRKGR